MLSIDQNLLELIEKMSSGLAAGKQKLIHNELDQPFIDIINSVADNLVQLHEASTHAGIDKATADSLEQFTNLYVAIIEAFNQDDGDQVAELYISKLLPSFDEFSEGVLNEKRSVNLESLRDRLKIRPNDLVTIGDFTYGTPKIRSWDMSTRLYIGKFCSISENVTIFLGGEHRSDWVTTYPFNVLVPEYSHIKGHPKSKGDIIIGNDVWIAAGATILSGVTIGDGAVIGAEALVSKDVPPYAIVAGNPAKIVKYRFDEDTIQELLKLRWWDWELIKIEKFIPLLLNNNIEEFITQAKQE